MIKADDIVDTFPESGRIHEIKHGPKLGPTGAGDYVKTCCRGGKAIFRLADETDAESSLVNAAIFHRHKGGNGAIGWGMGGKGQRVFVAAFNNLTPGIRKRGYVASTDPVWVELVLQELIAKGYKVLRKSWE